MRLDPEELNSIIKAFQECFSQGDHLWLFGSRVDDKKRGGDIDLYVEMQDYESQKAFKLRHCFWDLLQDLLGEQKIDIIIRDPEQDLLIHQIAQQEGIKIV
jgi:predicted nucleotidyltransferase